MERTSSPERTVQQNAERALNEENVENLRSRQQDILADDSLSADEKKSRIDSSIHEYLGDHGVQRDDANYQEYYDVLRSLSTDRMSRTGWRYGKWDPSTKTTSGKTGYDKLHDAQVALLGRRLDFVEYNDNESHETSSSTTETTRTESTQPSTPENLGDLETSVQNAREKWAKLSSKRAGKMFGGTDEEYETAEREYHEAVNSYGRAKLSAVLESDQDDSQKNTAVVAYLFSEQEELRKLTSDNLNGTKVGKFVAFMNRGNKWQRAAKGIALGFGAGIAGSMIAGIAGAGVLAAGAIGASRFVRGYATHDKRGMRKAEDHYDTSAVTEVMSDEQAALGDEYEDRFDSANRHLAYLYDDETKDQQKKRRKAFAWGAGSVAVGSVLGYATFFGASQAVKEAADVDLQLFHPLGHYNLDVIENDGEFNVTHDSQLIGDSGLEANPGGWPHADTYTGTDIDLNDNFIPDVIEDLFDGSEDRDWDADAPAASADGSGYPTNPSWESYDADHDGIPNSADPDYQPDPTDTGGQPPEVVQGEWDFSEINKDARWIEHGEGGWQTLQELGVPQEKWEAVWADAGNVFHDEGKTYMMDDGRWGWSAPGRMTNADLTVLLEAAQKNGVTLDYALAA